MIIRIKEAAAEAQELDTTKLLNDLEEMCKVNYITNVQLNTAVSL